MHHTHTQKAGPETRKRTPRTISKPLFHPSPNFSHLSPNFPFCATVRGFPICPWMMQTRFAGFEFTCFRSRVNTDLFPGEAVQGRPGSLAPGAHGPRPGLGKPGKAGRGARPYTLDSEAQPGRLGSSGLESLFAAAPPL